MSSIALHNSRCCKYYIDTHLHFRYINSKIISSTVVSRLLSPVVFLVLAVFMH